MTTSSPPIPPLLCHPTEPIVRRGYRGVCPACGSFWDVEACRHGFEYGEAYAVERRHYDPSLGARKVASLARWIAGLGIDPRDRVVCEIGFGGGFCLAFLARTARRAFGVEAIEANLEHAASLGLDRHDLWTFARRPETLPTPVSLWVLQDVFEHIVETDAFLAWVARNSAPGALLLVVAPEAGALSERLLDRFWPHRLADHLFHWSSAGLAHVLGRHGFAARRRFRPTKDLTTDAVLDHFARTRLAPLAARLRRWLPSVTVRGNIGEMGWVFEKSSR